MIPSLLEKKLLQALVLFGCLVPILAGSSGMLIGSKIMGNYDLSLDSHFRYLSGLLFGIGLGFLSCIRNIETKTPRFQVLTGIVVIGGIGRLIGVFLNGIPNNEMLLALIMELGVTPALCYWQYRVAKRF